MDALFFFLWSIICPEASYTHTMSFPGTLYALSYCREKSWTHLSIMLSSIGRLSKLFSHSLDSLCWILWFIFNCLSINTQLGDTKLWCLNTNYCQSISIAHIKCHLDYSLHWSVWKLLVKRREGHYPICWDSCAMDLSFCLLQIHSPTEWTVSRLSRKQAQILCPALKSIRSTGYECQCYFVELTCILSLLKYKRGPRLQEVVGFMVCTGFNISAQPEWKEQGHWNARKSKTTF